jgi:hypothetical protein
MAAAAPKALTGANQLIITGVGYYKGVTIRETAAAVATVRIYDGVSAAGTLLETIALAANESKNYSYHEGRTFLTGVFVSIVAGTVEGSVFV